MDISRPGYSECAPFYHSYLDAAPSANVLTTLDGQATELTELLGGVSEEASNHRYAPDKWSIKELLQHMIDTERVFCYRALSFSRKDAAPLPGMSQDDWATSAPVQHRTLAEMLSEYAALRQANIAMFGGMTEGMLRSGGLASGKSVTVRALVYILAGHEAHHIKILKEQYLVK